MYFDSHYYLQPSVGLEALYYKAAIELLQRDCELGARAMRNARLHKGKVYRSATLVVDVSKDIRCLRGD